MRSRACIELCVRGPSYQSNRPFEHVKKALSSAAFFALHLSCLCIGTTLLFPSFTVPLLFDARARRMSGRRLSHTTQRSTLPPFFNPLLFHSSYLHTLPFFDRCDPRLLTRKTFFSFDIPRRVGCLLIPLRTGESSLTIAEIPRPRSRVALHTRPHDPRPLFTYIVENC